MSQGLPDPPQTGSDQCTVHVGRSMAPGVLVATQHAAQSLCCTLITRRVGADLEPQPWRSHNLPPLPQGWPHHLSLTLLSAQCCHWFTKHLKRTSPVPSPCFPALCHLACPLSVSLPFHIMASESTPASPPSEASEDPLVQYIVVRSDLDWPSGALMGQASHGELLRVHPLSPTTACGAAIRTIARSIHRCSA